MGLVMSKKCAALAEAFITQFATVWLLSSVDSFVNFQIFIVVKMLFANFTVIQLLRVRFSFFIFLALAFFIVSFHIIFAPEFPVTLITFERFQVVVSYKLMPFSVG